MKIALLKFTPHSSARIENAFSKALFAAKEQILTDCNYFVKVDQGTLRDTSYAETNGTTLYAIWDTPYAKRQYYTGTPSKDKNPNASIMWAQKGADAHGGDWKKILQKGMRENL